MANKVLHAMYDDDHKLIEAAKKLRDLGIKVKTVYSPFPIHGIDPIIGVTRTRIGVVAFMFGLTGLGLALLGMYYFMIYDWPMNIGGKPSFSLYENIPAFIPVTFEFTVFCAAHGMAITYLLRNGTLPGMPASNPDPRTTDDKFVIEVHAEDNHGRSVEELSGILKNTDIIEISEREIES